MAPHDTNTPKEVRRHAGPLIGIGVILVLVLIGLIWLVSSGFSGPDPSTPSSTAEVPAATSPQTATPESGNPTGEAPKN